MSVTFNPNTIHYAVVEYLPSSSHLCDPVDTKPTQEGQYRLVCLATQSDEAWRIAHLIQAMSDSTYRYSVCVAEPDSFPNGDEQNGLADQQVIEIKPLDFLT